MTVRAALFDLDDTLLDDRGAMADAVLQFRDRHSLAIVESEEALAARWDAVGRELWRQMALGELSRQEQRRLRLQRVFGLALPDVDLDALFDSYLECYEKNWRLLPGVDLLISKTAHLRRAIVTNGHRPQAHKKLNRIGLEGVFDFVITPDDCSGAAKPELTPFKQALDLLGVSASEAVMIGDNEEIDLVPARSLGMRTILVKDDPRCVLKELHLA
jgi:putative hydrolase of the HAD superfamily